MIKSQVPIMRLVGALRFAETDWSLQEYGGLFERLAALPEKTGAISRYIRFLGDAGGHTGVLFFGIEMESTDRIPEGMTALELGDNTITVLKPASTGPAVAWEGHLTWNWLERSATGAPVGEFKACIPPDLPRVHAPQAELPLIDFLLTGNSYFQKGKAYNDDVRLVEYDLLWPAKFAEMAEWMRKTIPGEILLRVEHFGSTAIPNLPAKPVIDILIEIPSFAEAKRSLIPIFNKPECEYWGYDDHLLFIVRKCFMGTRTYHIHAAPAGRFWDRIAFRDYLRAHPDEADRYASLKRNLAARYPTDRETYTIMKGDYVREMTEKALRSLEK